MDSKIASRALPAFAIGFVLAVRALERWLTPWKGRE